MSDTGSRRAIVIGAGHNGLVCACYLARRGLDVTVLERSANIGGAAVTEEFVRGFRNSVASYAVGLLSPKVIRDLDLERHGLRIVTRKLGNFLPLPAGDSLKLGGSPRDRQTEIARFSERDAQRLPAFEAMLDEAAGVVRSTLYRPPPNAGGRWRDGWAAFGLARRLRSQTLPSGRRLLDLFTRSAGDILDDWFETDALKAALAFDGIVGTFASPYTPGTGIVLLHHVIGEVNGERGVWGHAIGGMGAITAAMAAEARRLGVRLETDTPVGSVEVVGGRVTGVRLAGGERREAGIVVSGINPRLLYLDLIDPAHLDAQFVEHMRRYRCESATFRMNVALSELPDFSCLPGKSPAPHHSAGIYFLPSPAYMDRAYADARAKGWSTEPVIEMLIPSTLDATLAPEGQHVASLFCQHFRYKLPEGRSWDDARQDAADLIIDTVDAHAPNFRASIVGAVALSPLDLERRFGLVGGDIFHGTLTLDQLFSARPMLGHADYRGPIAGLYMCGSGTHPGGGVTGIPGHNAAREVLRDL